MKDFQEVRAEKVIANLGGTAFLTETGKVIEGNYKVGDYAPVIYDKTSMRFLPAWKKEVSGKEIKMEEEVEVAGGWKEYYVGVMVTVLSEDYDEPIRIYFESESEDFEDRYVELPLYGNCGKDYRIYGPRFLRVIEDDPLSGMVILSSTYSAHSSDEHFVVLFKVLGKVTPIETRRGCVKYDVVTKIFTLPAMVDESEVPSFSIQLTHPNRIVTDTSPWKATYTYTLPDNPWTWYYHDHVDEEIVPGCAWCRHYAMWYPRTHDEERDSETYEAHVRYAPRGAYLNWSYVVDPRKCPISCPDWVFYDLQYIYDETVTLELESKNSDMYLSGKARVDIIGGTVWWDGDTNDINNLKYKIAGKVESFHRVCMTLSIYYVVTGGLWPWQDRPYEEIRKVYSATIPVFYLTETTGESWGGLEDVVNNGGSIYFGTYPFVPGASIAVGFAALGFKWDEMQFTNQGTLKQAELVYNLMECFYTRDKRRIVTFASTYVGASCPSLMDIIYYKIDADDPIKAVEYQLKTEEWNVWNYTYRNAWPQFGGPLYFKKLGDCGGSFEDKRVMFKTAGGVHVYIVDGVTYIKTRYSDWVPKSPPMSNDFVNLIEPAAREIQVDPSNVAVITLEESYTYYPPYYWQMYGKYYDTKLKETKSKSGYKQPPVSYDVDRTYGALYYLSDFALCKVRYLG